MFLCRQFILFSAISLYNVNCISFINFGCSVILALETQAKLENNKLYEIICHEIEKYILQF